MRTVRLGPTKLAPAILRVDATRMVPAKVPVAIAVEVAGIVMAVARAGIVKSMIRLLLPNRMLGSSAL